MKCLFAEAGVGHGLHAVAHGPDLVPEHQTRDDKPSLVAPLPRKCNASLCAGTVSIVLLQIDHITLWFHSMKIFVVPNSSTSGLGTGSALPADLRLGEENKGHQMLMKMGKRVSVKLCVMKFLFSIVVVEAF